MATEVNESDVERRLVRLREDWGDFHLERRSETVHVERFERVLEVARDGYTGGGYVWVVREPEQTAPPSESMPDDLVEERRVLLVLGRGADRWGPAGGGREAGETYEDAAVREVREETSVECSIADVGGAGRFVTECEDGRDERIHALYVVFAGRYEDGTVSIQPGEIDGAAWFRELPARLHPLAEGFAAEWEGGRVAAPDGEDDDP